jgi:hypothetical protein
MDPRNSQRWPGRTARFTLRDTPLTLRAKAAARAGLSIAEYADYSEDSPTRTALQVESAGMGLSAMSQQEAAEQGDELALAAMSLPTSSREHATAMRLATGTGHARSWGPDLDAGTLEGAIRASLTPQEAALYDQGSATWLGGSRVPQSRGHRRLHPPPPLTHCHHQRLTTNALARRAVSCSVCRLIGGQPRRSG